MISLGLAFLFIGLMCWELCLELLWWEQPLEHCFFRTRLYWTARSISALSFFRYLLYYLFELLESHGRMLSTSHIEPDLFLARAFYFSIRMCWQTLRKTPAFLLFMLQIWRKHNRIKESINKICAQWLGLISFQMTWLNLDLICRWGRQMLFTMELMYY